MYVSFRTVELEQIPAPSEDAIPTQVPLIEDVGQVIGQLEDIVTVPVDVEEMQVPTKKARVEEVQIGDIVAQQKSALPTKGFR